MQKQQLGFQSSNLLSSAVRRLMFSVNETREFEYKLLPKKQVGQSHQLLLSSSKIGSEGWVFPHHKSCSLQFFHVTCHWFIFPRKETEDVPSLLKATSTEAAHSCLCWFGWLAADLAFSVACDKVILPLSWVVSLVTHGRLYSWSCRCLQSRFLHRQRNCRNSTASLMVSALTRCWPSLSPVSDLNWIFIFFFAFLFWVLPTSQNMLSLIPTFEY